MYLRANTLQTVERIGEIEQCLGLKLVAIGPPQVFVGEVCDILNLQNQVIVQAEVIGFENEKVYLMPYDKAQISMGFKIRASGTHLRIPVGHALLGQVVNGMAEPIDETTYLNCKESITTWTPRINPLQRKPIQERFMTGIHAIDGLLPMGMGQRLGLFAGSGVGKSTLLGMIAKQAQSDIHVIALIGERGREVNEFIEQYLDDDLLKKTVLVVACSDESALMRKQAAYTATAIAEYFCRQGRHVMLFMDSLSRFAMAQREIGLSLGEPPTARGYPPSVFALLPGLIERCGRFKTGAISALYTVLVEGDDFNEPLSDHVRALVDGHIVLTRELAQSGHYPAISITQSISRLSKQLVSAKEYQMMQKIIADLSMYQQNKDLIELGAYKEGVNPLIDKAIINTRLINNLLRQTFSPPMLFNELMEQFHEILK